MSAAEIVFWIVTGALLFAVTAWTVSRVRGRHAGDPPEARDPGDRAAPTTGRPDRMVSPPERADRPGGPGLEPQRVTGRGRQSPGPEPPPAEDER